MCSVLALLAACHETPPSVHGALPESGAPPPEAAPPAPADADAPRPPAHVEDLVVPGDLTAFLVRRTSAPAHAMLYLSGGCTHPGGYVQAFQYTAAAHGDLVGLQGDVPCGGPYRRWSTDLVRLHQRVQAAFGAAGLAAEDVLVIGYSQGAERAEQLAARWPERYRRLILIASPVAPSARRLARAEAVVTMAGSYDSSLARMREAPRVLASAKVPATFVLLPGARHGQMGADPEVTMTSALDFVFRSP